MRINLNNFLAIGCWAYQNFPLDLVCTLPPLYLLAHPLTIPNTTLTPYISLALCVYVPTFIVTQGSNLKLMYNSAPSGTNHCIMVDLTAVDVLKYLKGRPSQPSFTPSYHLFLLLFTTLLSLISLSHIHIHTWWLLLVSHLPSLPLSAVIPKTAYWTALFPWSHLLNNNNTIILMSHVVLAMLKCFLRISLTTWQPTLHLLHHPRLSAASAATIAAPMIWWILWWAWQPCLATFCHLSIHWHLHTVIQSVVLLSFLSWTFMTLCLTMVMCDTTLSAIHLLPNCTRPPRSHHPLQQPRKWHAQGVVVSQVPLATMAHACSRVLLTVVARCSSVQNTLSVTFDLFIPLKNVSCLLYIWNHMEDVKSNKHFSLWMPLSKLQQAFLSIW